MPPTPTQLTPNLWVQQSNLYHTNSGIFVSGSLAGLIDPGIYPHEIEAIVHFLDQRGLEPAWLILTHSHWDHILGPERFPGVPIVAQRNYVGVVAEAGAEIHQQIAGWEQAAGIERTQPFVIPHPDILAGDGYNLALGGGRFEIFYVPGHAADQLALYQPDQAILWASDILSDVEIPFVSHSLAAFEATLTRLATLEIQVLAPGHGHPTTDPAAIQNRLSADRAYLRALRERVEAALRAGKSVAETVDFCKLIPYRNRTENEDPHRLNVESVYLELGGPGDPKTVGWGKEE